MTIIIIGAGAAGYFSAIHNKETHPDEPVILIEKGKDVLSKVKISGGGRCNVTHACFDNRDLIGHYPRGGKALLSAFHRFNPADTFAWFDDHGVPLKTESDGRMFPTTDSSQTIMDCLTQTAANLGVKLWTECNVIGVSAVDDGFEIVLGNKKTHHCRKLVLATGSSRSGHRLAASLGHHIEKPVPSLFTLTIKDKGLTSLSGVSVADVRVGLAGHAATTQAGPLLITHWGLSGPSIIKLSAWHALPLFESNYQCQLQIDFLPQLDQRDVLEQLRSEKQQHSKRHLSTQSPFSEIPSRLWPYLLGKANLDSALTWGACSEKQLLSLSQTLKTCPFQSAGKGVFKEEFVTCGGVSRNEIDFKTMESKICPGLFVIGELLDVDGVTGGFNFQNAWTGGFLSGQR